MGETFIYPTIKYNHSYKVSNTLYNIYYYEEVKLMGISIEEFNEKGVEHQGRAFGATSEERKQIITYLHENGACTPKEIGDAGITGIDAKLAKTRLDVMRRDEIVVWKDIDDETFYALTDKGIKRATGETVETKKTKKTKKEDTPEDVPQ